MEINTTTRAAEPLSASCLPATALRIGQQPAPLHLIESRTIYTVADIRSLTGTPFSIVCDFRVQDIESGTMRSWGFEKEGVSAIDHHMPAKEMEGLVSSTNLAIRYVEENGPVPQGIPVLINHTDCDSILSSAIVRGVLPPLQLFGEAALKADHLGVSYVRHEANGRSVFTPDTLSDRIADFLQAQDFKRPRSPEFAIRNLLLLMQDLPLEPEAREWLAKRHAKLEEANRVITGGKVRWLGPIAWITLESPIDSEFFPGLLPKAGLILITSPHRSGNGLTEFKLRLGQAAPRGFSIHNLKIDEIDPGYGGRWNAGANTRGGGTSLSPETIAAAVSARLTAAKI